MICAQILLVLILVMTAVKGEALTADDSAVMKTEGRPTRSRGGEERLRFGPGRFVIGPFLPEVRD